MGRQQRREAREATEAFRQYAARGRNTNRDEMLSTEAWLSDTAVSQTLSVLSAEGKENVISAIKGVYFSLPSKKLEVNDIHYSVTKFCMNNHVSEASAYRWLGTARRIFLAIYHHQK